MRVKKANAVKMIGAIKNSYSSKMSTKELDCIIPSVSLKSSLSS